MGLSEKKNVFIYYILPFFILLLLVVGVVYPLFLGVQQKSSKIISIKKKEKIIENLKCYQDKEKIKEDMEKIDSLFTDSQAPINLIQFWEETAKENNLLLEVNSVSLKSDKEDLWKSIGFQMNLLGDYISFLKFLGKIEYSPFLMKVQQITINSVEKEKLNKKEEKTNLSKNNLIKAVVVLKVFVK